VHVYMLQKPKLLALVIQRLHMHLMLKS
jgi:hypothetical protein